MNAITYASPIMFQALAAASPAPIAPTDAEPLVQMDKVAEFIGDDPDTQRQVFDLCLDLIVTNLPQLRQAINRGDTVAVGRMAHRARGSLGMLGLAMLSELGEAIEYRYNELGAERWRQRCEELCQLFERLQQELQERLAA